SALRQHPAVRESVALTVQGPDQHPSLIAYVVFEEGEDVSTGGLKAFLTAHLPGYMIPAAIVALRQMPLTSNGKVNRRELEECGGLSGDRIDYLPPASTTEKLIARIWEDVLGIKPIGLNHNFFELGGHSLLAVRVLSRLRDATGQAIPLAAIFQAPTIAQMARLLDAGTSVTLGSELTEVQAGGNRPRLYLVAGAGGTVGTFAQLATALGSDQPVWGFNSIAASNSASIEEIARMHVDELMMSQPRAPYFIGGWSFGAAVAFEMARELQAKGETVSLLVVLDMIAPSLEGTRSILARAGQRGDAELLADVLNEITRGKAACYAEEFEGLTRAEVLERAVGRLEATKSIPSIIPLDAVAAWLCDYLDRLRALSRYEPSKYSGPIALFKAKKLPADNQAFGTRRAALGPALGWDKLSNRAVEIILAEGSHFTMFEPPFVEQLGANLRRLIDRAASATSTARALRPAGSSGP
ncbi:MAG: thioesterase domain-containing protein, partial [Blastocatellia bacterium]